MDWKNRPKEQKLIIHNAISAMRQTIQGENLGLSESQIILLDDRLTRNLSDALKTHFDNI